MMEKIGTGAMDMLELAWGIIANAGGGNWETQTKDWQKAAAEWKDKYHKLLKEQAELIDYLPTILKLKGEIMATYEDVAIDAVRDWLMELLKKREWCQAKKAGKALEILIEDRNRPTPAELSCEQRVERSR